MNLLEPATPPPTPPTAALALKNLLAKNLLAKTPKQNPFGEVKNM